MIVCERCEKKNEAHYKFCLGCGADISHLTAAPVADFKPRAQPPIPSSAPVTRAVPHAAQSKPASLRPIVKYTSKPASVPTSEGSHCSECRAVIPDDFKFCGECGFALAPVELVKQPSAGTSLSSVADTSQRIAQPKLSVAPRAVLTLIRADGRGDETFSIEKDATTIDPALNPLFANDDYLSPNHALIHFQDEKLFIRDNDSLNGIYIRIPSNQAVELKDRGIFRIGREVLQYQSLDEAVSSNYGEELMGSDASGIVGRLSAIVGPGMYGNASLIPEEGIRLGRERGDLLFSEDGYVSGLHAKVYPKDGKLWISDLDSSNGTYLRIDAGTDLQLNGGDFILLGQQLFRVDLAAMPIT